MVSMSMGKLWGEKVEEIANLKAENQELKEELEIIKAELNSLKSEISENRSATENAKKRLEILSQEHQATLETSLLQEHVLNDLASIKASNESEIACLKSSLSSLQFSLDSAERCTSQSQKLEQDLRLEIKNGDFLRSKLEAERDRLLEELSKKQHDFEVLLKAKEHSDRHIAILVKEKDRIVNKSESKPQPTTSKIYETIVEEKVTSWGQVENQRLKALLEQEKKENDAKTAQIEKLQRENWNLLNRLRNKKP